MSVTFPLVAPTPAPVRADLTAGGLTGLMEAIATVNGLAPPCTAWRDGYYGLSLAWHNADSAVTSYCSGSAVDLPTLDTALQGAQASLAAAVLAIAEARAVMSADPGVVQLVSGGSTYTLGSTFTLARSWPAPP